MDNWKEYLLVLVIGAWGGIVNSLSTMRRSSSKGEKLAFSLVVLIADLACAAFCGLVAYWVVRDMDIPPGMIYAAAGVAGHMGSRTLFLLETRIESLLGNTPRQ